jgi:hypothetical protein
MTALVQQQHAARKAVAVPGGFRRLLLMGTVATLPLQTHLPAIAGASMTFLAFLLLTATALVMQPMALFRAAGDRILIAGYVLLVATFTLELLHANAGFSDWWRMLQMFIAAAVIASYCRRERDVSAIELGVMIGGSWVALVIARGSYGIIASASASGFVEASRLRVQALNAIDFHANWNELAFYCAAAATIAAARAILSHGFRRLIYAGFGLASILGTFLTFSRSGIIMLAVGFGYVFFALISRRYFFRTLIVAIAVLLVVANMVPAAIFQRLTFSLDYEGGQRESRAGLYATIVTEWHDYAANGIGAQNYWEWWATAHGLHDGDGPTGTHNVFLQFVVFWGLPGLMTVLLVVFLAWRSLAFATRDRVRWVSFKGFSLVVLLWAMAHHDASSKVFSITFGAIAGLYAQRRYSERYAKQHQLVLPRTPAALRQRHA